MAGGPTDQYKALEAHVVTEVTKRLTAVVQPRWDRAIVGGSRFDKVEQRLVAAGKVLTTNEGSPTKAASKQDHVLARRQIEAWAAYEEISEVTTLVDGTSNLLSQCRLYMGKRVRDGDRWLDVPAAEVPGVSANEAQLADAVLARLVDDTGSQAGLIRNISQNWSVVGSSKLVGYWIDPEGNPLPGGGTKPVGAMEIWRAVAPTSLTLQNKDRHEWTLVMTESGDKQKLLSPITYEIGLTHPRWPGQSLGWVMAALDICRDLRAFTGGQRSAARSGIPADLLLAPIEANPKKPAVITLDPEGQDQDDPGDNDPQRVANEFAIYIEALIGEFIMDVLADLESGASAVPGVLTVPADFIEKFKTISFARTVDRGLGELVNQARTRLGESADCPPEALTGLGSTNRWNGTQITEDEYRRYFRPKANAIGDGLTAYPVRHRLLAAGQLRLIDDLGLRVLIDPSDAIAPPDYSKLVLGLLDRATIGPKGARTILRIGESMKPSPDELKFMEEWKQIGTKAQAADNPGRGDQGAPSSTGEPDSTKGTVVHGHIPVRPPALAAAADGLADRLLRIELDTRSRLTEASEAALDRALDRFGSKLRSWARKAQWGQCEHPGPGGEFARFLGPERAKVLADANPTTKEEMWSSSLESLSSAFDRIAHEAYAAAQAAIGAEVPEVEIDAAIARAEAALIDGMMELADLNVFAGPGQPEGEQTSLRVPSPLMRRVLAIAGGALGVSAGLDPTAEAAFGLAFGPLLDRITPETTGLQWMYGEQVRKVHFEPHQALDGQTFASATDPGLEGSVFGAVSPFWFPGDHGGCLCAWRPIYVAEGN